MVIFGQKKIMRSNLYLLKNYRGIFVPFSLINVSEGDPNFIFSFFLFILPNSLYNFVFVFGRGRVGIDPTIKLVEHMTLNEFEDKYCIS